jgi:tetratricopeptide (TPR) repeat protein
VNKTIKMNMYKLILVLIIISSPFVLAQDGDGQAGTEHLFSFGFGARAMGMGHAFSAIANDASAVHWNPAGLDRVYQQSVMLFHASLLEGGIYDFLGYAYPTLDLGTFGFGIARYGIGDVEFRNQYKVVYGTGSFDAYRVYLSYGLELPYDLAAGASLKVDRVAFYDVGSEGTIDDMGIGFDFGLMYRPTIFSAPFLRDWSLGLNIQNLFAPQLKPGDDLDVLPLTFRFGIARKIRFMGPGNGLNIAIDLGKSENTDMTFSFGTEYSFQDLGMVRLGYDGSALAFGAGVKYNMFQIDYAFGNPSTDGLLDPIHRLSLSFNFGLNRDEMYEISEENRLREKDQIISDIREADKQKFIAEHLQKAEDYFGNEQYLDAIGEYQAVINADPFHQRAKIMLDSSNVLLENQFQERQLVAVQSAVDKVTAEENQKFIDERFERGRLYLDQKQFTKALIEFNLALERDAENETILGAIQTTRRRQNEELGSLVRKGRQELQNENYSEALRIFSEAQLLNPDDPNVLKEIGTLVERTKIQENIQKGLMLYDIGEFNNALDVFGQILETDPNNEFIKQYYDRSKIETLDSSGEMAPAVKRKYLEGVDKFLLGKYQEAIIIWEEVLETDPYNKKVLEAVNGAKERIKRAQSEE